jgi:hypothetical protein
LLFRGIAGQGECMAKSRENEASDMSLKRLIEG